MSTVLLGTIPGMGNKNTQPSDGGKRGPGRPQGSKPTVPLYARIAPKLAEVFASEVESLRPKSTQTSVMEMLIEQWLIARGVWPPVDE